MVDLYDTTFAALAHPTRRDILSRLRRGEATVGDLAGAYDMSLNAVSKHLMVLEKAQLIRRRIEWRVHYISLNPAPLQAAAGWLETYRAFWERSLDGLEEYLARKKGENKHGA
ncbi:MAG TPA: metalloregulator ArsR/SmtB family transcription factor [Nevskia sp.]|nr:metalloregulator ArsR/SmtB family transcription factor [Nevskia sp.]